MHRGRRLRVLTGAASVAQTSFKKNSTHNSKDLSNTKERLIKQLAFYGSYHANPWNKLIHFIFVPLLLWSSLVFCCYLVELDLEPSTASSWDLATGSTVTLLATGVYCLYYLSFDFIVGLSWSCCIGIPSWITASIFRWTVYQSWKWALLFQFIGWFAQLYLGHGIFEKRRPAFMDSFFQSIVLAPLFVWYEFLFYCGFYQNLRSAVDEKTKLLLQQQSS
eukprot:g2523.t1